MTMTIEPPIRDGVRERTIEEAVSMHGGVTIHWDRLTDMSTVVLSQDNLDQLLERATVEHLPEDHPDSECELCSHCGGLLD